MGKYATRAKKLGGLSSGVSEAAKTSSPLPSEKKNLIKASSSAAAQKFAAKEDDDGIIMGSDDESSNSNYMQLRSRRLIKKSSIISPVVAEGGKRQKGRRKRSSSSSCTSANDPEKEGIDQKKPALMAKAENEEEIKVISEFCGTHDSVEDNLSLNLTDGGGDHQRTNLENTPPSLTRNPDTNIARPLNNADSILHPNIYRPTSDEFNELFARSTEEQQRKEFIEKYNFDIVKDEPLPGRYQWEKLKP